MVWGIEGRKERRVVWGIDGRKERRVGRAKRREGGGEGGEEGGGGGEGEERGRRKRGAVALMGPVVVEDKTGRVYLEEKRKWGWERVGW